MIVSGLVRRTLCQSGFGNIAGLMAVARADGEAIPLKCMRRTAGRSEVAGKAR